jgi:hypothetical protein
VIAHAEGHLHGRQLREAGAHVVDHARAVFGEQVQVAAEPGDLVVVLGLGPVRGDRGPDRLGHPQAGLHEGIEERVAFPPVDVEVPEEDHVSLLRQSRAGALAQLGRRIPRQVAQLGDAVRGHLPVTDVHRQQREALGARLEAHDVRGAVELLERIPFRRWRQHDFAGQARRCHAPAVVDVREAFVVAGITRGDVAE